MDQNVFEFFKDYYLFLLKNSWLYVWIMEENGFFNQCLFFFQMIGFFNLFCFLKEEIFMIIVELFFFIKFKKYDVVMVGNIKILI